MTNQDMPQEFRRQHPLTDADARDLDRMFVAMARWWDGWPLARIAAELGVTRQRVGQILSRVACTLELRNKAANRERPDSPRRACRVNVDQARAALLHPLAHRLTPRQRAALAWQAQGFVLVDVARRLGTTCQGAQGLAVAGKWRLGRLAGKQRAKAAAKKRSPQERGPPTEVPAISREEIDRLLGWTTPEAKTDGKGPR